MSFLVGFLFGTITGGLAALCLVVQFYNLALKPEYDDGE